MSRIPFQPDPDIVWARLAEQSGRLAFDVGANAGDLALVLARRFDKVAAFEPCRESYEHLALRTMDAPPGSEIWAANMALSDRRGMIPLIEAAKAVGMGELVTGDSLSFSWGDPVGERWVESSTLDRETERHGPPDFVKIDTEGHELKVVQGGMGLLNEHRPRLLIEVHEASNGARIVELLPHYQWERVNHPGYRESSPHRENHYYLWGEA